jgi:hypothetical protein
MTLTGENQSTHRKNLSQCHFIQYQPHVDWSEIKSTQYEHLKFSYCKIITMSYCHIFIKLINYNAEFHTGTIQTHHS